MSVQEVLNQVSILLDTPLIHDTLMFILGMAVLMFSARTLLSVFMRDDHWPSRPGISDEQWRAIGPPLPSVADVAERRREIDSERWQDSPRAARGEVDHATRPLPPLDEQTRHLS